VWGTLLESRRKNRTIFKLAKGICFENLLEGLWLGTEAGRGGKGEKGGGTGGVGRG